MRTQFTGLLAFMSAQNDECQVSTSKSDKSLTTTIMYNKMMPLVYTAFKFDSINFYM